MSVELAVSSPDAANIRRSIEVLRPFLGDEGSLPNDVIVSGDAVPVRLDAEVFQSMIRVLEAVAATRPGAVEAEEVTPQEAAAILRMSRPTVMRLIEKGELATRMVGTHHRLDRRDVLAYRDRNAAVRRDALRNLTDLTETYDF